MLDAYIIDAIRRERAAENAERDRVWLELPLEAPEMDERAPASEPEPERGVIIIPLHDDDEEDEAA